MHEQAREREEKLQQELEKLKAELKKRERQLFGRKSEKSSNHQDGGGTKKTRSPKKRGQQPGRPGPGRRDTSQLPAEQEHHTLAEEQCRCDKCGLPFVEGPGSEDSEVIEIEVKAHKRRIHRQNYRPTCECDHLPGVVTPPPGGSTPSWSTSAVRSSAASAATPPESSCPPAAAPRGKPAS